MRNEDKEQFRWLAALRLTVIYQTPISGMTPPPSKDAVMFAVRAATMLVRELEASELE